MIERKDLWELMQRIGKEGLAEVYRPGPSLRPEPATTAGSFYLRKFRLYPESGNTAESIQFNTDAGVDLPVQGYSLHYLRDGSSPAGRIQISFNGGSEWLTLAPGDRINTYFDRVQIRNWAPREYTSAVPGVMQPLALNAHPIKGDARILIICNPNLVFEKYEGTPAVPVAYGHPQFPEKDGAESNGGLRVWRSETAEATVVTPYSAGSGVEPEDASGTEGFPLDGVRAFRVVAEIDGGGANIISGQLDLWCAIPRVIGGTWNWYWFKNQTVSFPVNTTGPRLVWADETVIFPYGRGFVAPNNVVTNLGGQEIVVEVYTWGLS